VSASAASTVSTPAGGGAVLVTGASSGIGAAIAARLAEQGRTVGCLSRRGTTPAGGGCVSLKADITDEAAVARALEELDARSPLTGLVNCAGRHIQGPSAELSTGALRDLLETNFIAAFAITRQAYPRLKASGGGLIVNVGSFYDRLGVPENLAYAASKTAIGSMTRSLAVEWAREGIRVLNVAPGYVETELNAEFFADEVTRSKVERRIPVRRVGEADEVARLVAGLFAMDVGFLTGTTIYVDGGHGVAL
jgi:NAD(P)-dependent dehydrogenase (short-subunit alcohol dehydrogenase family)